MGYNESRWSSVRSLEILMVEVLFPPVTRRARNKNQKRDEPLSANLAVKANFASAYGGTVPALTYTYTGLVNGDSTASFSGGLATTATSSSSVGVYAITQGTLAATGNYTIGTFNPATLAVGNAGFEAPRSATATSTTRPARPGPSAARRGTVRASPATTAPSPRATPPPPRARRSPSSRPTAPSLSRSPAGPPGPTPSPSTPQSAATAAATKTSRCWSAPASSAPSSPRARTT